MTSPFIMGLGVASAAMIARGALALGKQAKANPEFMRQAGAAAEGFKGMKGAFKVPSFLRGSAEAGFDTTMSRGEAAKILGIRRAPIRRPAPRRPSPAPPSPRAP
jgi:hypothetical protein